MIKNLATDSLGKIGILSDAHGNGPAFKRAIAILEKQGAKSFWFLGDAVGYIPSFDVIDSIRMMGSQIRSVSGNHEQIVISNKIDAHRDSVYQHTSIRSQISQIQMEEITSWPRFELSEIGQFKIMFCHGSPNDLTGGYLYEDSDLNQFSPEADFVFVGNTHRPFIRKHGDKTYVNVGSCGLPRDNGILGSVGIFNPITGSTKILRFDIEKETKLAISGVPYVHSDVIEVISRRSNSVFGDLV